MPWVFLAVSLVGAVFTLNALHPPRRPESLSVFVFFASWLTGELPYHHLAWQAIATVVFVALGALRSWPGWVGLAVTGASWVGLVRLAGRARDTAVIMETGLRAGLGDDYGTRIDPDRSAGWGPATNWRQLVAPLPIRRVAVTVTKNIVYAEPDGKPQKLDVYRPAMGAGGAGSPVLLFVHGSAWVTGDKREQGLPLMTRMASHGWVCVTINHRLSPKATFPEHLLDVKAAIRWVREHGAEYGADPSFIVISGASAGGHLAALAALTPNDPRYQPGFEGTDTTLQGALLFYGVYDLTNRLQARGRGFVWFVERVLMKKRLAADPEAFAQASPMDLVRADAPPMMIIHGLHDTLVPAAEARHFADLLRQTSRAPVVYVELTGAQHAFEVFPSIRALHAVAAAERFCDYVWCDALRQRASGDDHVGQAEPSAERA